LAFDYVAFSFRPLLQNAATYYIYGTFSSTTSVPIIQAPDATNPGSYDIVAPIGAFGGTGMTF
jgi:hypothetical protein